MIIIELEKQLLLLKREEKFKTLLLSLNRIEQDTSYQGYDKVITEYIVNNGGIQKFEDIRINTKTLLDTLWCTLSLFTDNDINTYFGRFILVHYSFLHSLVLVSLIMEREHLMNIRIIPKTNDIPYSILGIYDMLKMISFYLEDFFCEHNKKLEKYKQMTSVFVESKPF